MRTIKVAVELTDEEFEYFERCARIRDVCRSVLMRRIVSTVMREQLIGSVLDDADELRRLERYEHRYRTAVGSSPR